MKLLLQLILVFVLMIMCSCLEPEKTEMDLPVNNKCIDNYAEYYYNDTMFITRHSPELGEFLTPDGNPCGIAAVLDQNANRMTMRIVGVNQNLGMSFEVSSLSEQLAFSFANYTNNNIDDAPFSNLVESEENFIIIDQLDTTSESITGQFKFTIENSDGVIINLSQGKFECFYSKF